VLTEFRGKFLSEKLPETKKIDKFRKATRDPKKVIFEILKSLHSPKFFLTNSFLEVSV